MRSITYNDIDIPFKSKKDHPEELFIKNKQFSDQNEGRIVLNINNEKLLERFQKSVLEIGSLKDIAVLYDHYHAGGMWLTITLKKR